MYDNKKALPLNEKEESLIQTENKNGTRAVIGRFCICIHFDENESRAHTQGTYTRTHIRLTILFVYLFASKPAHGVKSEFANKLTNTSKRHHKLPFQFKWSSE